MIHLDFNNKKKRNNEIKVLEDTIRVVMVFFQDLFLEIRDK